VIRFVEVRVESYSADAAGTDLRERYTATYDSIDTGRRVREVRYYNKSADEQKELLARDSYKYFVRKDQSDNNLYFSENTYYVYEYSSRALSARRPGKPSLAALAMPPASHHLED
jgi:hypothetical protein